MSDIGDGLPIEVKNRILKEFKSMDKDGGYESFQTRV